MIRKYNICVVRIFFCVSRTRHTTAAKVVLSSKWYQLKRMPFHNVRISWTHSLSLSLFLFVWHNELTHLRNPWYGLRVEYYTVSSIQFIFQVDGHNLRNCMGNVMDNMPCACSAIDKCHLFRRPALHASNPRKKKILNRPAAHQFLARSCDTEFHQRRRGDDAICHTACLDCVYSVCVCLVKAIRTHVQTANV